MRFVDNEYATLSQIEVTSLSFAFEVVMAQQRPSPYHNHPYSHSPSHSQSHPDLSSRAPSILNGPWGYHSNQSTVSLNSEVHDHPGQPVPIGFQVEMGLAALSDVSTNGGSRRLDGRLVPHGQPLQRPNLEHRGALSYNDAVDIKDDKPNISRISTSPVLPRDVEHSASNSNGKEAQRGGYDVGRGRRQHSLLQINTDSSDSDGSIYSQEDAFSSTSGLPATSLQAPPTTRKDKDYSKQPTYSSSSSSHSDQGSMCSSAYKERVSRFMQGHVGEPSRHGDEPDNLGELIDQEHTRYEQQSQFGPHHEMQDVDPVLMPPPLAIRTKKHRQSYFSEQSGEDSAYLSPNAQKAMDWSILNTSAPQRQYSNNKASSVSFQPNAAPPAKMAPTSDNKHKRRFSSGKHPLKSPFPLRSTHNSRKSPNSPRSAGSFGGKFSEAFKRISPAKASAGEVIPNTQRNSTGPDTPMPKKSGFMGIKGTPVVIQKSNEHIHGVVEKAKLSMNKKEKRRRELKKQIVVVGVTDQSPDGRTSEWL